MFQVLLRQLTLPLFADHALQAAAFEACTPTQSYQLLAALDGLHDTGAYAQAVGSWVATQRRHGADDDAVGHSLAQLARHANAGDWAVWGHVITQRCIANAVLYKALQELMAEALSSSGSSSSSPRRSTRSSGNSSSNDELAVDSLGTDSDAAGDGRRSSADAPRPAEALFASCLGTSVACAHRLGYPHIVSGLVQEVLLKLPPGDALVWAARELRSALPEDSRDCVLQALRRAVAAAGTNHDPPEHTLAAAMAVACDIPRLRSCLEAVAARGVVGCEQQLTGACVYKALADLQDAELGTAADAQYELMWQVRGCVPCTGYASRSSEWVLQSAAWGA